MRYSLKKSTAGRSATRSKRAAAARSASRVALGGKSTSVMFGLSTTY
jgi:hypothetical protein